MENATAFHVAHTQLREDAGLDYELVRSSALSRLLIWLLSSTEWRPRLARSWVRRIWQRSSNRWLLLNGPRKSQRRLVTCLRTCWSSTVTWALIFLLIPSESWWQFAQRRRSHSHRLSSSIKGCRPHAAPPWSPFNNDNNINNKKDALSSSVPVWSHKFNIFN